MNMAIKTGQTQASEQHKRYWRVNVGGVSISKFVLLISKSQ